MPFEFEKQRIDDVILVKPKVFGDNRRVQSGQPFKIN